jgi:hypothetical protein
MRLGLNPQMRRSCVANAALSRTRREQLLETLFAFANTKLNYVSVAVASPRTPSGKQATLLASRRERHYELRITNYELRII